MLAGHYAPAYFLRGQFPAVSLLVFFVAVQAPDIAFFTLAPLGIEHVRLDPTIRGPLGMDLVSIPYTHSLVLTLVYGGVITALGGVWRHPRAGFAVALAVVSHWALDYVVHVHDLPVTPHGLTRVGLGLWQAPLWAYLLEVVAIVGAAVYLARRVPAGPPRRWLYASAVVLVAMQTRYMLVPPPATTMAIAIQGQGTYAFCALMAWAVDRQIRRAAPSRR